MRIDREKIAILKVPKERYVNRTRSFTREVKITAYMSTMCSNSIRMMGFTDRVGIGKPGGMSRELTEVQATEGEKVT